jgi:hypothetical protein
MHNFLAYIEENCLESIFMSIPRSSYYYENAEFYHKNKQYFDVHPRKTISEYNIDLGHAGILNTWRTTEFNKEIDKIILKHFDKQKYYEDNIDKYYALAKNQITPNRNYNNVAYLLGNIAPEYAKKLQQESVPKSDKERYAPKSVDEELTAKAAIEHKEEFDKITSIIDDIKKLDSYDYASVYSMAKDTNTNNAITLKVIEMVEEEVKTFVESHPF